MKSNRPFDLVFYDFSAEKSIPSARHFHSSFTKYSDNKNEGRNHFVIHRFIYVKTELANHINLSNYFRFFFFFFCSRQRRGSKLGHKSSFLFHFQINFCKTSMTCTSDNVRRRKKKQHFSLKKMFRFLREPWHFGFLVVEKIYAEIGFQSTVLFIMFGFNGFRWCQWLSFVNNVIRYFSFLWTFDDF